MELALHTMHVWPRLWSGPDHPSLEWYHVNCRVQVSHHPPIGVGHGENDNWTYDIVSAPSTKFLGNSVEIYPVGEPILLLSITVLDPGGIEAINPTPGNGLEELLCWCRSQPHQAEVHWRGLHAEAMQCQGAQCHCRRRLVSSCNFWRTFHTMQLFHWQACAHQPCSSCIRSRLAPAQSLCNTAGWTMRATMCWRTPTPGPAPPCTSRPAAGSAAAATRCAANSTSIWARQLLY
jgi:Oxysterol-binding protein